MALDMIYIFRQGSKKREQDRLSPVVTVMILLKRKQEAFLIYVGGAGALNVICG